MRWMSNWSSTESEEDGNEPSMKARRISFAPAAPPPSPTELGKISCQRSITVIGCNFCCCVLLVLFREHFCSLLLVNYVKLMPMTKLNL